MMQLSLGSVSLYMSLGVLAGVLSGALGVGSGILLVPALVLLGQLPQQTAQGTALAVMVPMALVGAIRYGLHGELLMDYRLAGVLVLGAVVGALVGSELALRLPPGILRKAFAVLMVVVAIKMFCAPTHGATVAPTRSASMERMDTHDSR